MQIYANVLTFAYMCIIMYSGMDVCPVCSYDVHVYLHIFPDIHVYICIFIYAYVYIYIDIYIYVCTYIYV